MRIKVLNKYVTINKTDSKFNLLLKSYFHEFLYISWFYNKLILTLRVDIVAVKCQKTSHLYHISQFDQQIFPKHPLHQVQCYCILKKWRPSNLKIEEFFEFLTSQISILQDLHKIAYPNHMVATRGNCFTVHWLFKVQLTNRRHALASL